MDIIKLTDDTFEQEVLKSEIPAVVDFWAEWCQPCQIVSPTIDELAKDYTGKIKVGKVNVDENAKTPGMYGIMSIPTVMIFKNSKAVKTLVGVQGKDVYKKNIDEALAA